jgi:MoaA/NifB/PqqE/SkfB family radical SAM enzyme
MVSPTSLRIIACALCQLSCPLCPSRTNSIIKQGKLSFDDFRRLIDRNPQIRKVELGGWGEAFLNEDLPKILRYSHAKEVITAFGGGTNLNQVSDEALESLVLYQTARVRCSIDGVTQETYEKYRVGGNLHKVIRNIQRINALKEQYRSSKPHLIFQFIVFGHNQHEIERAAFLARMLKMEFFLRLNYVDNALPVQYRDRVRRLVGYADRKEYLERTGRHYTRRTCYQLWRNPQIRWDGKVLGCSANRQEAYNGNVFQEELEGCINSEKLTYVREMLMGRKPPRGDIPCVQCDRYKIMARFGNWITETEIHDARARVKQPGGG